MIPTDLLRIMMEGMSNHLESPELKIRKLCMILGEKMTLVLKMPVKDDTTLKFEYDIDEDARQLLTLFDAVPLPSDQFYQDQKSLYEKVRV